MKSKIIVWPVIVSAALLGACAEPQQPATAGAPNEPTPQAADSGSFAASETVSLSEPAELSLEERRLQLTAHTACNLERANGAVFTGVPVEVLKSSPALRLSGWAANSENQSVPAQLDVRMVSADDNRAWKVAATTGGQRDDVVKLLGGNAAFASAGFATTMSVAPLPVGTYRLYIVYEDSGNLRVCDNGRAVVIKG